MARPVTKSLVASQLRVLMPRVAFGHQIIEMDGDPFDLLSPRSLIHLERADQFLPYLTSRGADHMQRCHRHLSEEKERTTGTLNLLGAYWRVQITNLHLPM